MFKIKQLAVVVLFLILIVTPFVLAAPADPTVSLIGNNNATFTSTGTGNVWFRWGVNSDSPEWKTPNQTAAGAFSATAAGSPYYPSIGYYVKACDDTGCSNAVSFTSLPTTPLPQTTYGMTYDNITQNGFNVLFIIQGLPSPYFYAFPGLQNLAMALIAGLLFGFYILGLWLRQRKTPVVFMIGIIILAFIISPALGFGWGMPQEMIALAQMLAAGVLAGMLMSLFKKG
jgi:hypothetical protein